MASQPVDAAFAMRLPKLELHAHLTGSISVSTLHEIWQRKKASDKTFALEDPLIALSPEKGHFNVLTFFPLFDSYIYKLCSSVDDIRVATLHVLRDFQKDGVRYLELRTTPRESFANNVTKENRRNTVAQAMETVDLAIKFKERGIVGVDLCGDPTKGDVAAFRDAFGKARSSGLKVTLHFAEVPKSSTLEELRTLLSYQPDRLGHVINVPDEIKEEVANRYIGLELCLSCNVHAKLVPGGFADHHFGYWLMQGLPISLCTDDVGIFRSPVSNEYPLAAQHFGLDRADLIRLTARAMDSIFAGQDEKLRMMELSSACQAELYTGIPSPLLSQ